MPSPATRQGGTGLIYVILLLLVLGGGAVAVWLIVKNGTPKAPAPAPAPASTPAPAPKPGDWALHEASGPYVSVYARDRSFVEVPPPSPTTAEACTPTACDGTIYDLPIHGQFGKFPAKIEDAWSYVRWDDRAAACYCGVFFPSEASKKTPQSWAGHQLPSLCAKTAQLADDGRIVPYASTARMYTNYDALLTVPDKGYNLCDDFTTQAPR